MIKTENLGDDVIGIILDRPNSSHNFQDEKAISEFYNLLKEIEKKNNVKGVVIYSAKKSFLVGGDLDELRKAKLPAQVMKITVKVNEAFRFMENSKIPFVAAINGLALGGGLELALACNYRIGALDNTLKLGLPEVTLGLMPGGGGTQRLPRLIGYTNSLPILMKGAPITAEEAENIGLLDECVPKEKLLKLAKNRILEGKVSSNQLWDNPQTKSAGKPSKEELENLDNIIAQNKKKNVIDPALVSTVEAIREGADLPFDKAIKIENEKFANVVSGAVAKNKIRTLFYALNTANSFHVRPKTISKYHVSEVAVIGGGLMGSGIAYRAALAGINVNLMDVSKKITNKAIGGISKIAYKAVDRKLITKDEADKLMGRITPITEYRNIKNSDLVIEAVSENIKLKQKVFSNVLENVPSSVPVASNTSTISIGKISTKLEKPENIIGLHFFAPVERMKLVEVVKGNKTSDATLAKALDFLSLIKKTPIVVNDCHGFFTSRVVATYTAEAITMLSEGVSPSLLDNCAIEAGMPIGPLEMADITSLVLLKDIFISIIGDGDQSWVKGINVLETLDKLIIDFQRTGKRDGKGIYSYADNKTEEWSELKLVFPSRQNSLNTEVIEQRLFFVQALEAARALEEGVVENPVDADLASVLGWAFPSAYGGVLGYVDHIGIDDFVSRAYKLADEFGERFIPPGILLEMKNSGGKFHRV